MALMTAAKFTGALEEGNVVEVVRKDHTGRILRISKYRFSHGAQRPVSEQIFDPEGHSTLYLYDDSGKDVKRVFRLEKQDSPA